MTMIKCALVRHDDPCLRADCVILMLEMQLRNDEKTLVEIGKA